ncbi:MAG TPA: hypothetical protein VFP80_05125 [Thermoanaerobaculia bacterium]|nr:hypothetical protein [Thermoanaerobaculia bacterium]
MSASVLLAQEADLAVEKLGPSEAPAASDVSYSIAVTNVGPDDASSVSLSDPVPAGMSFVSATQDTGPSFACDSTVNCTIASLPAGATATFTFVFHIDSGTQFLNTATVSSQTFDPNDENNSSVAFTTVAVPQADLFVQKSAAQPGTPPDADVTFLITLGNAGPDAAQNVTLTDNLPPPLTFVSFTQTSGPAMTCGVSTCTAASFPAGATATFELVGHVPPGTPSGTEILNTATVESDNDPLDENNSATTGVIVASADVRVAKTGPPTADAGTTIAYQVTVTNDGPDAALNVVVTDPQICDTVNCNLGTILSGQSVVLNANVTIPPDATSWSNTAVVTTDSFDPDDSDNSSTANTIVTQSADVSVEKTAPADVVASTDLTYTITVENDGPSDASNVVLTDTLPAGTTFVSSSCGTNPCAIGTLAAGASVVVTIVVNVAADATGPLENTATVTSTTSDPIAGNNTSIIQTTVTPAPVDLSITKTSDPTAAVVGSNVEYTIVVTNNGPGAAADVVVTDTLPAGTTLVSASAGCTGTTTVTCTVGTLAAGASATIELIVTMPSTPGVVSNTASADTSSTDPTPGNDASTAQTTVGLNPADLSITKTADRPNALVGSNVEYTIIVTNNGPGEATDVVVTDTLPAGTTLVSSSAGCTGTTTITCTVGTLASGASATIELVVTMPSTPGTVSNTATVESSSTDPTPGNDSSTAVVAAQLPADSVPALSPGALLFLSLTMATIVLVVLRRAS